MHAAPLPLLGTFHEVSVVVADVRVALEFYEGLGFSQATTTDTLTHPYGVVTDGRIFIGLHQRGGASPVLTFVRAGVAQHAPAFADAGLELTVCRTGEEVFNEIAFADPFGHAVAVIEARTYSPVERGESEPSLCGDFAEVSLPVTDFGAARRFGEGRGFVATGEEVEAPYLHLPLTSDHLDVSCHRPLLDERTLLVFRDPDMAARIARLRERGLPLTALPNTGNSTALIESPEGPPLLLLADAE
jgi:catechol 2,3-dioxygenase-like lactoylglutathione lyase family enzyme